MAYRLRAKEPVSRGLIRAAQEQIDKALAEIRGSELPGHEKVHQLRKRLKKLRAVLRLVRPEIGSVYREENVVFRDLGREFSRRRDARVYLETLDFLEECVEDDSVRAAFGSVRDALGDQVEAIREEEAALDRQLTDAAAFLVEARQRAEAWPIPDSGFEAVAGGLKKTYGRGRNAYGAAYEDPTAENFHEWRKRVKYHWYHARLLRNVWPDVMKGYCSALSGLSDILGREHDLTVLMAVLTENRKSFENTRDLQVVLGAAERNRSRLRREAAPVGARVYAEKPKRFVRRMGAYWSAWKAE